MDVCVCVLASIVVCECGHALAPLVMSWLSPCDSPGSARWTVTATWPSVCPRWTSTWPGESGYWMGWGVGPGPLPTNRVGPGTLHTNLQELRTSPGHTGYVLTQRQKTFSLTLFNRLVENINCLDKQSMFTVCHYLEFLHLNTMYRLHVIVFCLRLIYPSSFRCLSFCIVVNMSSVLMR